MAEKSPRDRAHAAYTMVLLRMPHGTAGEVAKAMDISDGDLSGLKNKHLEPALLLLAHLGLKVVSADMVCVSKKTFEFLTEQHERMVVKKLAWAEDDAE